MPLASLQGINIRALAMKAVKSVLLSKKRSIIYAALVVIAGMSYFAVIICEDLERFLLVTVLSGLSSQFLVSNAVTANLFGRRKYTLPMAPRGTPGVSEHWCLSCPGI